MRTAQYQLHTILKTFIITPLFFKLKHNLQIKHDFISKEFWACIKMRILFLMGALQEKPHNHTILKLIYHSGYTREHYGDSLRER